MQFKIKQHFAIMGVLLLFTATACSNNNEETPAVDPPTTTVDIEAGTSPDDEANNANDSNETLIFDPCDVQTSNQDKNSSSSDSSPNSDPMSEQELLIIDELTRNAEDFEYEIGDFGGSLSFATISNPLTFNPAVYKDASSGRVLGYLFEGLTRVSWLDDRVEPELAQWWETSEDGTVWTFHLRQDVKWHDGEKFTAADVDFTFNRIIYNEDIDASDRAQFTLRYWDAETW